MYTEITLSQFRNDFKAIRPDNFSYEGLEILFNHLEELENDCGIRIELDVLAICCDYSEDGIIDILLGFGLNSLDGLRENTIVLEVDENTIIYQNY